MPDPISGTLGFLSVGSSIMGANAAEDAADAQSDSARAGIAEQRAARQSFEQRTDPFRQAGLSAAAPLLQSLGIQVPQSLLASSYGGYYGPATTDLQAQLSEIDQQIAGFEPVKTISGRLPFSSNEITVRRGNESVLADLSTRRTELQRQLEQAQAAEARGAEFAPQTTQGATPGSGDSLLAQANPLVSFLRDEGFDQIQESAAAQGNLRSGGTLRDLTRFNTDLASTVVPQLQQQRFNQLFNLLGLGQNAATGQGSAALSTASNIGSLLGQQGQAAAQGQIGRAQAVQGGISDLAGIIGLNSIRPPDPFMTAQSGYQFNPQSDPFSFGGF